MRDYIVLLFLPVLLYAILRKPFIGVGLCLWSSMLFPNAWLYGVASDIRFNLLFAGFTLISFIFHSGKKPTNDPIVYLVIAFFIHTSISTAFGITDIGFSNEYFERFTKTILLFVLLVAVCRKKIHVDFIIGCMVLSVGVYGVLEALKFLTSGGVHKVKGFDGHALGDRNELALAMAMLLPLAVYLFKQYASQNLFIKCGLLGVIVGNVIAILGTHSRGGLITLCVLLAMAFKKSRHKLLIVVVSLPLTFAAIDSLPEGWFDRMSTVQQAEDDESFMGRVVAWKLSTILAVEKPILGGGYKAVQSWQVWQDLSARFHDDTYSWFPIYSTLPSETQAFAAHSIYFQVLGDSGFPGLILFLGIIIFSLLSVRKIKGQNTKDTWRFQFSEAMTLSLLVFMVGGAALSFAYYEILFCTFGLIAVVNQRLASNEY